MSRNAIKLLENLSHLAKVAKQVGHDAIDVNGDGKIDWQDLVTSAEGQDFSGLVDRVLGQTKRKDVLEALARVSAKKVALRADRSYAEMSDEELDRYDALRATERLLHRAADKIERDRAKFVAWLVDDALPVFGRVLKTVVPLIV